MNQDIRRVMRRRKRRNPTFRIIIVLFCLGIVGVLTALLLSDRKEPNDPNVTPNNSEVAIISPTAEEPTPTPIPPFFAAAIDETKPSYFDFTFETDVTGDGEIPPINFGMGSEYTSLEGVISFRGNNFRSNAAYGTANVTEKILEKLWQVPTYSLKGGEGRNYSGSWTGSGWTGQPILVKWPHSTKQIMNMFDWAKADNSLIEAIYATMDGNIYFLDLVTGRPTRDKMVIGVPFKGAGSLDPRGYPLLYLGSGDHYNESGKEARAMIVSLIDCKIIYEFGKKGDKFALRSWTAYDSSALVSAEADTLIYPGENGILYVIKLNTHYDEQNGTISVNPGKTVKLRYDSPRTKSKGYWHGYEGSAAAWKNYLFLTENSGLMHCVDLNKMEVVWVQDIKDDTNASPAFEIDNNGKCYIYIGNTLDNTADSKGYGTVGFYKIDAETGEIVWVKEREVYTTSDVTGGVMTSAVLGENKLKDLVFIVYASYGNGNRGDMVAFNKTDGTVAWETKLSAYTWSSPVAVYDQQGNGYLIQCNYSGNVYLIDGIDGTILNTFNIESNIEASPAVFDDIIVIRTRVQGILGIKIK
ncbi:MAG: PQQ-binding-like beta-propeller repeat protein [Clostridiales bacterium]|nr:PQQ-binding-like beta-propeller repeat protein [Clostridiales bacterium]